MALEEATSGRCCAMCVTQFGEEDTEYGFSVERFRPIHAKWVEYWPSNKQEVTPAQLLHLLQNGGKRVYVCYLCHVTIQRIEEFQTLVRQSENLIKAAVEERWEGWPQEESEEEGQVVPYDAVVAANSQSDTRSSSQRQQDAVCCASEARPAPSPPPSPPTSPLPPTLEPEPCCSKTLTSTTTTTITTTTFTASKPSKEVKAKTVKRAKKRSSAEATGSELQPSATEKIPEVDSASKGIPQVYPFFSFGPDEMILSQPSMRLAAAKSITLCRAQIKQLNSRSFIEEASPVKKAKPRVPPSQGTTSALARASRIRKSAKKITDAAKRHATRQSALCTKRPQTKQREESPRNSSSFNKILMNGPAVNCVLCDVKFFLDSTGDKRLMEKSWKLAQEGLVVHFGSAHNPVRRNVDITRDTNGKEYYSCTVCSFKAHVDATSTQPQRNLRINAHVKLSRHYLRAHGSELTSIIPPSTPRRSVRPRPVNLFGSPTSSSSQVDSSLPSAAGSWRQCPHPECTFQASIPGEGLEGQSLLKPGNYRRVELKLARHYLRTHEFPNKFKVSGKHPCVKKSDSGYQLCFACPRCPYEKKFDSSNRSERTSRDTALSLFLRHYYRNHVYNSTACTQGYSDVSTPGTSQDISIEDGKKTTKSKTGSKTTESASCPVSKERERQGMESSPSVTLLCPESILQSRVFEFEVEFRGPVDVKPFKEEAMTIHETATP